MIFLDRLEYDVTAVAVSDQMDPGRRITLDDPDDLSGKFLACRDAVNMIVLP